ncbi:MAG: ATP-dependent zinc metalloprotease FtsH [Phycisphaerales bacterium]|nr:ATP-dependent zinc metalloprotease FtsH [Phycisphaerales bacterium]
MTDPKSPIDPKQPVDPKKDPKGNLPPQPPQKGRGTFGFIVVMLMVFMLAMFLSSAQQGREITFQQFEQYYENKKVKLDTVTLTDAAITAQLIDSEAQDGQSTSVRIPITATSRELMADKVYALTNNRVIEKPTSGFVIFLYSIGPFLIILLIIWFLLSRSMRGAAGGGGMLGSFGKSKHRAMTKEMTGVTFKDVAGIEEAKDEVTEIIEFLKTPKKFTKLGGRIPRGVLLAGSPGCGKTLLAKAIAGEADVPFFSISGSDFVEMFVGVGASRVRDLFKQAKESSPCIIFLDEIDAVGRRRGGGFTTGGHDEREQTLNAILVEMDGFESGDGVIVIAATNRPDVLDPALVRPGRFDRQITVPLPDVKGRLEILKVHAKKVKLGPNVDLSKLARGTPMFSGADLAAIINEAAIGATMHNKDFIEHEDLEEARDKVKFGRAKKSRVREKDENQLVAYHEAGHAVLQALLKDADPLHKVTIIPRGASGGATFSLPEKDRMGYSLKWLKATMRVICGGRIAEAKAMDDVSSGASSDIQQVTRLARAMILEWGMSPRLGFVNYQGQDSAEGYIPDKDYSDDTAKIIDEETKRIVDEAYTHAESMLTEHWDKVEAVAQALLKYENLSADEVHSIMRGEPIGRSTVAELLAAEPPAPSSNGNGSGPKKEESTDTDTPPDTLPSPA